MVKVYYNLKFSRFRGTKRIDELDYYALAYFKNFCKLGAGQKRMYDGAAYVTRRKVVSGTKEDDEDELVGKDYEDDEDASNAKLVSIQGEIVCDAQAYLQHAHATRCHALGDWEQFDTEEPQTELDDAFANLKEDYVRNGYDAVKQKADWDKAEARWKATIRENSNYLILPNRLLGYSTRVKLWGQFMIDDTTEPSKPNMDKFHKDLQLETRYRDLLKHWSSHTRRGTSLAKWKMW
ncbi:Uu.00g076510.m01.CDS01 [Anthostomella pinea]|uniref:Uu.00g076510.m01.CDS01 n=1 Tax=Anthostomella pinea TaxID=933095 RepID=A0AAI8VQ72_9PEZI|nr:Uu.00g076510.m01.CDS01 [Anthostomella pinea]